MLVELVNLAGDVFQAVEQHLFGDFVFVEEHHFLDGAHAALEVFAHGDDLANDDRRTRQRLEHAQLAALDALGDFDFAFAREQRNGAHLAQVHADGIVGFFQRAGREVELDVFAGFHVALVELVESAGRLRTFEDIDALAADGGHQIVEIVGRLDVVRDKVVHLVVGEVALLFSHIDQFLNVVKLVFKSQSGISSAPSRRRSCSVHTTAGVVQEYQHMRKLSDFSTAGPAYLVLSAPRQLPMWFTRAHKCADI